METISFLSKSDLIDETLKENVSKYMKTNNIESADISILSASRDASGFLPNQNFWLVKVNID